MKQEKKLTTDRIWKEKNETWAFYKWCSHLAQIPTHLWTVWAICSQEWTFEANPLLGRHLLRSQGETAVGCNRPVVEIWSQKTKPSLSSPCGSNFAKMRLRRPRPVRRRYLDAPLAATETLHKTDKRTSLSISKKAIWSTLPHCIPINSTFFAYFTRDGHVN